MPQSHQRILTLVITSLTVTAEVVVVFFVPAGTGRRIDAAAPSNCPF